MFGPSVEQKKAEIEAVYNAANQKIAEQLKATQRLDQVAYLKPEEKLKVLADAYRDEKRENAIQYFCSVLKELKDPQYIRLANAIRIVDGIASYSKEQAEQEYVMEAYDSEYPSDKKVKTTFKELQEVRHRNEKQNLKMMKKLRNVWKFVDIGLMRAVSDIEKICHYSLDASEIDDVMDYLDSSNVVQAALVDLPEDLRKIR